MEVVSEANRYVVNQACAEAHLGHHVLSCDTKCFRKTKSLAFLFFFSSHQGTLGEGQLSFF